MRAAAGLLIAAFAASGCFIKPDRPGQSSGDGGTDSGTDSGSGSNSGPGPHVRLVNHAYYALAGQFMSDGMSQLQWTISTAGVVDNDLLIFIANIDNGSNTTFKLPTGFTQTAQHFFGTDGQTYVAGYKVASGEPSTYTALYQGGNIHSADAVIMLLAVTGYDPAVKVSAAVDMGGTTGVSPVPLASDITTMRANSLLVFAGGADWFAAQNAALDAMPPAGYTTIEALGCRGTSAFDWTALFTAYKVEPNVGDTGQHLGELSSTPEITGIPWTVELAIPPPP